MREDGLGKNELRNKARFAMWLDVRRPAAKKAFLFLTRYDKMLSFIFLTRSICTIFSFPLLLGNFENKIGNRCPFKVHLIILIKPVSPKKINCLVITSLV